MNDISNWAIFKMDELDELRRDYANQLPGKISDIETLWEGQERAEDPESVLEKIQGSVHRLAGSGAMYGFVKLSEVAHDLDSLLINRLRNNIPLGEGDVTKIDALMVELRASIQSPD